MGRIFTRTIVGIALTVVLSLGWSDSARAVLIFFDVTLTPTSGISNPAGTGSFSIDGDLFTGSGFEGFRPVGAASGIQGLVSMDYDFGGSFFSIDVDIDFPDLPAVDFIDGVLAGVDYIGELGFGPRLEVTLLTFVFRDSSGATSAGTVSITRRAADIPEPPALWLFSLGLALLLVMDLWSRSAAGCRRSLDLTFPGLARPSPNPTTA